jgi:pimeloyl-ACP methyl ester carboxylesterase
MIKYGLPLTKRNFQKIFIELPGHGQSTLSDDSEQPSLNYYANEVQEVLSFLKSLSNPNGDKRFTIFAYSEEDGERQIISTPIRAYESLGFRLEQ